MKTVEEIKAAIEAAVPGAGVQVISNPSPSGQHSLLVAHGKALQVGQFLRDDAELALDFLSNVTGVDWLDKEISEKVKVTRTVTKADLLFGKLLLLRKGKRHYAVVRAS